MLPKNIITKQITIQDSVDDVELPPPHLTSRFKTLQDWLLHIICRNEPQKSISEFKFGLFELRNSYVLFLVGINIYNEGENRSITRIEFEPTDMYFKLPKTYYENLNREEILNKLFSQLKEFANTEKFKTSFLAKAKIIVFETNGQTIWSK